MQAHKLLLHLKHRAADAVIPLRSTTFFDRIFNI
jgi:hypothetical protein